MPGDTDKDSPGSGVIAHLRQALAHAQEALRAYIALVTGQIERRVAAAVRQAMWTIILAGLALLGIILLACGLATFLESRLGVPGAGPMLMGGALLALVVILAATRNGGKPK